MKKLILIPIFFLLSLIGYSATYYIATTGNNSNSGDITHPFATPNIINTVGVAGDIFYVRGGDYTFLNQTVLTITKKGTANNHIQLINYPNESPVFLLDATSKGIKLMSCDYLDISGIKITGLSTVSSWTNAGNNIYTKSIICESAPNMLTIDGVNAPMGRYPNSTYLTPDTYSTTQITDSELPITPNFTNAELVWRTSAYVIHRYNITDHTSHTLTYEPFSEDSTDSYVTTNKYFIQNNINCLDVTNEWCYNNTTLSIYGNPTGKTIKLALVDNPLYIQECNHINITNCIIEGSNLANVKNVMSDYTTIDGSTINYGGKNGIEIPSNVRTDYFTLTNSIISNVNSVGFYVVSSNNLLINNTIFSNIGIFAGMASKTILDGCHQGYFGYNVTDYEIKYNSFINIGFNAINFDGHGDNIHHNYINTFCTVKDDGAGIYTWNDDDHNVQTSYRYVHDNIILNGIGAGSAYAHGIYMDDASTKVEIYNNTVGNCNGAGLFIHHNTFINAHNNTFYDNATTTNVACWNAMVVNQISSEPVRNCRFANNILVSTTNQKGFMYMSWNGSNIQSEISQFGSLDSNYYAFPLHNGVGQFYATNWTNIFLTKTFDQWKLYSAKDANSHLVTTTVSDTSKIKFLYNDTTITKTYELSGTYIDVYGVSYTSSVSLAPFTSKILFKTSDVITNHIPTINNQTFSLNENSSNGTVIGTVIASDSDIDQELTYLIISGNTGNTFAIDQYTGELSVNDKTLLDYETTLTFNLIIQVTDNGNNPLSKSATIKINLLDVYEPPIGVNVAPIIANQTFNVKEFTAYKALIAQIIASDPNTSDILTFTIVSEKPKMAIGLYNSGVLYVLNSLWLDSRKYSQYKLVVKVTDNNPKPLSTNASITINVLKR